MRSLAGWDKKTRIRANLGRFAPSTNRICISSLAFPSERTRAALRKCDERRRPRKGERSKTSGLTTQRRKATHLRYLRYLFQISHSSLTHLQLPEKNYEILSSHHKKTTKKRKQRTEITARRRTRLLPHPHPA